MPGLDPGIRCGTSTDIQLTIRSRYADWYAT
jgi:hypothetical protein